MSDSQSRSNSSLLTCSDQPLIDVLVKEDREEMICLCPFHMWMLNLRARISPTR